MTAISSGSQAFLERVISQEAQKELVERMKNIGVSGLLLLGENQAVRSSGGLENLKTSERSESPPPFIDFSFIKP